MLLSTPIERAASAAKPYAEYSGSAAVHATLQIGEISGSGGACVLRHRDRLIRYADRHMAKRTEPERE